MKARDLTAKPASGMNGDDQASARDERYAEPGGICKALSCVQRMNSYQNDRKTCPAQEQKGPEHCWPYRNPCLLTFGSTF
mmetsp:Transcript_6065/g.13997  ORF Transcript_6065/g.13997 Transcript_6065/m.13997 type:complete len:80 (-) Transcript_6065:854-1093(-)